MRLILIFLTFSRYLNENQKIILDFLVFLTSIFHHKFSISVLGWGVEWESD